MPRVRRQSARTLRENQARRDAANRIALLDRRHLDSSATAFENHMRSLEFSYCHSCLKQCWLKDLNRDGCSICRRASGETLFSAENGMDLGAIPDELCGLSIIEQILIARVHPVVSVFSIRGCQTGYSGHTMNFAQHIERIATRLPHNIHDLNSVILLNRTTPNGLIQFRVRSAMIKRALTWLQSNNQYYHDIIIDQQHLSLLPDDGDIVSMLPVLPPSEDEDPANLHDPNEVHNDLINASGYPNVPAVDAANAIDRNLQRLRAPARADEPVGGNWPSFDQERINEFSTEGLICQAFPVLFPYGRGDLNAPRLRTITNHKYFQYLMDYRDRRFANDLRFPYYAFNTLARWDALNCGNVFIRMNEMDQYNYEDLREIANDPNSDLAARIMYHGTTLRGTRAFWEQRCSELTQMVRQLGTPTIFFTLSAADYHWPDLFRLLRGGDNSPITEKQRAALMHNNPMVTAKYFDERCTVFMKKFMMSMFPIKDSWYRYEWQHRGSPHIHGLLWLDDAPDCSSIDSLDDQEKQLIIDYFDPLVSATIGRRSEMTLRDNPCRIRYTDLNEAQKVLDLDRILSSVQTHSRCGNHCMRKRVGSSIRECRFGFPIQTEETSSLRQENGSWKFIPKRNDPLIQRYNKFMSQVWRGNTDFSAITSKDAVLKYISKYASKGEYASEAYSDVLKQIINRNPSDSSAATLIRQLLVSSVAERNFSAQEIMHLLMGWPLYHASRTFVILSLTERWQRLNSSSDANLIRIYARREGHEDLTLYECAKSFRIAGGQLTPRQKQCIVRVIPFLQPSDDPVSNEEYFKLQCKLHIPWRGNFEDNLPADSTWEEFYFYSIENINADDDEFGNELPLPEDIRYEDDPLDHAQIVRDAGMAASRLHPGEAARDPIGHRPIDEAFEWQDCVSADLTEQHLQSFFSLYRRAPLESRSPHHTTIPYENMSRAQQEVLDLCRLQLEEPSFPIKRVLVQGKAGTGKSAIIKAMCQLIASNSDPSIKSYEVLAPTGAAALNVDGKTIHSFFQLPVSSALTPLNGEALRKFQLKLQNIKFIIIDEYSMVGLRLFTKIHKRLQQARVGNTEPFAGFNIYLFGDLRQLPPVMDIPIYMDARDDFSRIAMSLIQSLQRRIELSVSHRQAADQIAFKDCLDHLASGNATHEGWELLMTRRSAINPSNRSSFNNAIHLFPTNLQVREHNEYVLGTNQLPIAEIHAVHNNASALQADESHAQGLSSKIYLSIGCRIMLRKNLDVPRGLVNGSLGTVRQIIFNHGERPPALPKVLLVEFDNYTGPCIRDQLFPLLPTTASWVERGVDCSRKQYPINLAYALTIHKAQGLTLEKAIVDIGSREASPGLSYVALSRVKKLDDLLILNSFNFTRLQKIGEMRHVIARERFLQHMNAGQNLE